MREERALEVIRQRLAAIPGIARVELDPPDDHGDSGAYPAIAILPGDTERQGEGQQTHLRVRTPVTIRAVTQAEPDEGNGDLPLSPRTAGYALLQFMLQALWPGVTTGTYWQKLDGQCHNFLYTGHAIYPHDDGGKSVGVYIDSEMEHVLHLDDPDK